MECPASSCTSFSDPPTVEIFRAALVMKVRRPLWLEQPTKPRCRYHLWNMFTMAWAEVSSDRSVQMTWGPAYDRTVSLYSIRACLTSSLRGMNRPDLPLLAESRPPGFNSLQQQDRFDSFLHEFNEERPHEALDMKRPADLYTAATRRYDGLPELTYPFHDRDVVITSCGRLCLHRKKINISVVLAGQKLGIKEVDDGIWLVSFMHYDLGYFDLEQKTLQPLDNPFGPKPVIHVSATTSAL